MKIPDRLKEYKQWVMWRYEDKNGKPTKIPYTIAGKKASTTDQKTWTDWATAVTMRSQGGFDGIGFVFTRHDPFIGIDWDHCIKPDPDCGDHLNITPEVMSEIKSFVSYAEISPSGTGVHCICIGNIPDGARCRNGSKEIYTHSRFFTFTGKHLAFTPERVCIAPQNSINEFLDSLSPRTVAPVPRVKHGLSYKAQPTTKEKVLEVVDKCRKSKYKDSFRKLFLGDWSEYHSQSEADFALCYIIARFTNNPTDVDVIFRKSKLLREKWITNNYYRTRTIDSAMQSALVSSLEDVVNED